MTADQATMWPAWCEDALVELSYPEVGATRDRELPDGYRRLRARARVGVGARVFSAAVRALRGFDMQRAAGLRMRPGGRAGDDRPSAEVGTVVVWGFGVAGLRLWAPCRVVWVVDEPTSFGYAYGTLPGHPERGEESFRVWLDDQDTVWFELRSFSRPGQWYSRLGAPLTHLAQDLITQRYRSALVRLATTNSRP